MQLEVELLSCVYVICTVCVIIHENKKILQHVPNVQRCKDAHFTIGHDSNLPPAKLLFVSCFGMESDLFQF